ncbi:LCP family protein [Paenibacillus solisilvae]|uniref:LCP family protein n=1 Tax=Paenibacillus solisilvae TaxID=2486751 RepID=A0ABW0W707_9BACL
MKRRYKKILMWSGIAIVCLVIIGGGYAWYLYHSAKQEVAKMYEEIARPVYVSKDPKMKPSPKPADLKNNDPFTVLLLGVDQRENDKGRSDTMIVLSVNPNNKSILMFNIPRDTRTDIVGHDTVDKINHAYAFGDVEMSIQTVEQFLDYPIDYYMKVNMEGFERLIDLIGGVKVDNPYSFNMQGHEFAKGRLSLNGSDALLYSRMRYDDPRGDLGRNARQRELLQEMMRSSLNLSNITRVRSLLNEMGDSIKTNITFEDMKTFMSEYRPGIGQIDTIEIKGKAQTINGIWYYIVNDDERSRIHNVLKDHLQTKEMNPAVASK